MPELTREAVVEIVRKHRLSDLAAVKKYLAAENFLADEEKLVALLNGLVRDGTIKPSVRPEASFQQYLLDIWRSWWFYASIVIALFETVLVVSNAQSGIVLSIRIIFGLGILGFVPGFLTTLVLFPKDQLETLERIALGIFLSVLISVSVGVLLGLGPYFQPSNNVIILAGYVVLVDVAASYRSYKLSRTFR